MLTLKIKSVHTLYVEYILVLCCGDVESLELLISRIQGSALLRRAIYSIVIVIPADDFSPTSRLHRAKLSRGIH